MLDIIIHTDGGCSGNPGPGAWAYVMRFGERLREDSGYDPDTTNNRMELKAVIEALDFISSRRREVSGTVSWLASPMCVVTDSQYVKNGVTLWLRDWKAKGWKTSGKKPVKNQELWIELDGLVTELKPSFAWVEGHAGELDNERCDALVRAKIAECRNQQ
ncbi:MAG: ribonuclease HI [Spirochaetes bacterium]|nr:ribonuclease HI [Spirochaetota bacterium]